MALGQVGLLGSSSDDLRVRRVVGTDPVTASASVARESHPGGAPTAIIAGTSALADGVVATGLAGALDAPILLNEQDRLSPQIREILRELDVERVVLVGGTTALQDVVVTTLRDDLRMDVVRIAGLSRFDTAAQAAELVAAESGVGEVDGLRTALLVPAEDVPASLEAGGLAASSTGALPVLISQGGALNDPTLQAIGDLGIEQLLVVVSPTAPPIDLSAFDGRIRRIEGPAGAADMTADIRDFRPPRAVVVPSGDQARTLIAGPLAGRESGVILPSDAAEAWLAAACGTLSELFVVGQPDVITDGDVSRLESTATTCPDG